MNGHVEVESTDAGCGIRVEAREWGMGCLVTGVGRYL